MSGSVVVACLAAAIAAAGCAGGGDESLSNGDLAVGVGRALGSQLPIECREAEGAVSDQPFNRVCSIESQQPQYERRLVPCDPGEIGCGPPFHPEGYTTERVNTGTHTVTTQLRILVSGRGWCEASFFIRRRHC